MQDWDTRIKNLKNDIQIARQKYVIPFTKSQAKALKPLLMLKKIKTMKLVLLRKV